MQLSGSMTVEITENSQEVFTEEVLGSDFGQEECETRNIGDNDYGTWYIYKYFSDEYEATVKFMTINDQLESFEGPYISDVDNDSIEVNIISSNISLSS